MTELKATPGPWVAEGSFVYALVDTRPEDRMPGWPDKVNRMSLGVTMYPRQADCEPGEAEANAHLIAAAPDMREAARNAADEIIRVADYLKTALDNDEPIHESSWLDGLMEAHGELEAALSKARGE